MVKSKSFRDATQNESLFRQHIEQGKINFPRKQAEVGGFYD